MVEDMDFTSSNSFGGQHIHSSSSELPSSSFEVQHANNSSLNSSSTFVKGQQTHEALSESASSPKNYPPRPKKKRSRRKIRRERLRSNGSSLNGVKSFNSDNQKTTRYVLSQDKRVRDFLMALIEDNETKVRELLESDRKLAANKININGTFPMNTELSDSLTYLQFTCWHGFYNLTKTLLDYGADPDKSTKRRCFTALHFAVLAGKLEICKLLLNYGASITSIDKVEGCTPVEFAITSNNKRIFKLLIDTNEKRIEAGEENVFNMSQKDADGNPMIILSYLANGCCMEPMTKFIIKYCDPDLLLSCPYSPSIVNINERSSGGYTLLDHIIKQGDIDGFLYLTSRKYVTLGNVNEVFALASTSSENNKQKQSFNMFVLCLKFLLCEEDDKLEEYRKHFSFVETSTGKNPLHFLAETSFNADILNPRQEVETFFTANEFISFQGTVSEDERNFEKMAIIASLIIKHFSIDIDAVDSSGNTAMHLAAKHGNGDLIKFLICKNASLTIHNKNGWMPLHIAVRSEQLESVKHLVQTVGMGVDLNLRSKNKASVTPLILAASWERRENSRMTPEENVRMVKFLTYNTGNVLKATKPGNFNCLHAAARSNNYEALQFLLHYLKTQVTIYNSSGVLLPFESVLRIPVKLSGFVPLHYAAERGHTSICDLLIQNGANPHLIDANGCRPIDVALKNNQNNVILFLRMYCREQGEKCELTNDEN